MYEIVRASNCYTAFNSGLQIKVERKCAPFRKHTVRIFPHEYGTDNRLVERLLKFSAQQPNLGVTADRDPRERGSRPLNTDR